MSPTCITALFTRKKDNLVAPKPLMENDSIENGEENIQGSYIMGVTTSEAFQIFGSIFIAGFAYIGLSLVLYDFLDYELFEEVPEMRAVVMILIGSVGLIDATFTARVSTLANFGCLDSFKQVREIFLGNISLIQCQSIVFALFASGSAAIYTWLIEGKFNGCHFLLISASGLSAVSFTGFVMGGVIIGFVICARKLGAYPQVLTPITAVTGSLLTLITFKIMTLHFFETPTLDSEPWIVVIGLSICLPLFTAIAVYNFYTRTAVVDGWNPICFAILILGVVLLADKTLDIEYDVYKELAVWQPVLNGVCGGLLAIHACRISTYLHERPFLGSSTDTCSCVGSSCECLERNLHNEKTDYTLIKISTLIHILLILPILIAGKWLLAFLYLTVSLSQMWMLVSIIPSFVHLLWKKGTDPDDMAIPYIASLVVLVGAGMSMGICYLTHSMILLHKVLRVEFLFSSM